MASIIGYRRLTILLVLLVGFSVSTIAQHSAIIDDDSGAHKFTLGIGHTYFTKKQIEAKNMMVSAYVLNYDYVINKHWSVGSHNDLLIESESTEVGTTHTITERPVITKLMGLYSPVKDGHLLFGLGDEIKGAQNHLIINLGIDYGIHIAEGWEIAGEISYDSKIHGADSWIVGVGICRTIRRHHKS